VEYPSISPDLTPIDFFLWSALKFAVYTLKSHTLRDLRHDIETACAAVPLTIENVRQYVIRCYQQCIAAGNGRFEYL
jgi:hypothetical protein